MKRKRLINILLIFVLLILGILLYKKDQRFPLDKNNYPASNYVVINNEKVKVTDEDKFIYDLDLEDKNSFSIELPEIYSISKWVVNLDGIDVIEENNYVLDENANFNKEGQSPNIQTFIIDVHKNTETVSFKLTNKNDLDQNFEEINEIREIILIIK